MDGDSEAEPPRRIAEIGPVNVVVRRDDQ